LVLFGLAAWLVAVRLAPAERRAAIHLLGLAAIAVGVPAILALAGFDLLNPRNALAGVVPVLLAAALAFGAAKGRLPLLGLAGSALLFAGVVLAVNLSSEMRREDWRGAATAMGEPDGVRIVVAPKNGDDPLELYLGAVKFEGKRFEGGVEATEVEVLSASAPLAAPDGFDAAGSERLPPLFELASFRAERPTQLVPADLDGLIGGRYVALIDRP